MVGYLIPTMVILLGSISWSDSPGALVLAETNNQCFFRTFKKFKDSECTQEVTGADADDTNDLKEKLEKSQTTKNLPFKNDKNGDFCMTVTCSDQLIYVFRTQGPFCARDDAEEQAKFDLEHSQKDYCLDFFNDGYFYKADTYYDDGGIFSKILKYWFIIMVVICVTIGLIGAKLGLTTRPKCRNSLRHNEGGESEDDHFTAF